MDLEIKIRINNPADYIYAKQKIMAYNEYIYLKYSNKKIMLDVISIFKKEICQCKEILCYEEEEEDESYKIPLRKIKHKVIRDEYYKVYMELRNRNNNLHSIQRKSIIKKHFNCNYRKH